MPWRTEALGISPRRHKPRRWITSKKRLRRPRLYITLFPSACKRWSAPQTRCGPPTAIVDPFQAVTTTVVRAYRCDVNNR